MSSSKDRTRLPYKRSSKRCSYSKRTVANGKQLKINSRILYRTVSRSKSIQVDGSFRGVSRNRSSLTTVLNKIYLGRSLDIKYELIFNLFFTHPNRFGEIARVVSNSLRDSQAACLLQDDQVCKKDPKKLKKF